MRDLRQWLEKPSTSAGAQLSSTKEDLDWLENSKDLSSVQLGKAPKPPSTTEVGGGGVNGVGNSVGGGFSGGFAPFKSCVGKRK